MLIVPCMLLMTACSGFKMPNIKWPWDNDKQTETFSFAKDSWDKITANSARYNVGDKRIEELTTGEEITLVILGKNHDDLADGSGKAKLSIGMDNLLLKPYVMHSTYSSADFSGWKYTDIRNISLQEIFTQLPAELQNSIKKVSKISNTYEYGVFEVASVPVSRIKISKMIDLTDCFVDGFSITDFAVSTVIDFYSDDGTLIKGGLFVSDINGNTISYVGQFSLTDIPVGVNTCSLRLRTYKSSIVITSDDLFLFSEGEVAGENAVNVLTDEGRQYEYWAVMEDLQTNLIKYIPNRINPSSWYLRSSFRKDDYSVVSTNGTFSWSGSTATQGLCFGFCV